MPQYVETPAPNVDVHTGTYQVGTAPKSLQQKAKDQRQLNRAATNARAQQKVKSYAPGSDPSIKGKTSFSDGSVQ